MSTTLRDFIANREAEIREQLKALKAEQKELQLAKAALDGPEPATSTPKSGGMTIKDMALFVLRTEAAKDGMTSHQILAGIKQEFHREIDRTSLSPQLSRLKADEEIGLIGEKWYSRDRYDAELEANVREMLSDWDDHSAAPQEEDSDIPF
jgi:hypothetical protein